MATTANRAAARATLIVVLSIIRSLQMGHRLSATRAGRVLPRYVDAGHRPLALNGARWDMLGALGGLLAFLHLLVFASCAAVRVGLTRHFGLRIEGQCRIRKLHGRERKQSNSEACACHHCLAHHSLPADAGLLSSDRRASDLSVGVHTKTVQ